MALKRSKIEETVSTNPGVLANGYEKSFSFLIENLTFSESWSSVPPVTWYIPCSLGIAPTGKMTLIGKLGLVLEELEIQL